MKNVDTTFTLPKPEMLVARHVTDKATSFGYAKAEEAILNGFRFGIFQSVPEKPYGFISAKATCDVFCYGHAELNGQYVVFKPIESEKGLKTKEIHKATEEEILLVRTAWKEADEKASAGKQELENSWVEHLNSENLKKWELEKTIFEKYGFYAVKVDRETHNNYGSWVKENYEFSREITKEEFVVYLKATNANLVPEKVDAPVCQGEINLYPTNRRWSDTSECWTRHETFVYYD